MTEQDVIIDTYKTYNNYARLRNFVESLVNADLDDLLYKQEEARGVLNGLA